MDETQDKKLDDVIVKTIKEFNSGPAFTSRKPIDNPMDSYAPVNRRFVTLNGAVANRPKSSVAVIGQTYFATDTNIPMTYSVGGWRNGVGSIVAVNN